MQKVIFIVSLILMAGSITLPAYAGISIFDSGPSGRKSTVLSKGSALIKAEKAFIKGKYEEVLRIGNDYLTYRARPDDGMQYLMGKALLKLERFNEARNRFSRILNDSDDDNFLDDAYRGLADSYYLERDYKKAKEHYEKVIRYFPDSDNMHIVYYKLGDCYSRLNDKTTSKRYYDKLVKLYPHSFETKLLVGERSNFITYSVQVGSFKKWKNSKKLYEELKKKGFDANIHTVMVGDSRFYRVRVGQYSRLSDAEDMTRTLRNMGYTVKIYP